MRLRHKASGAALGLSCAVCFEQPAGVFAGCGAKYSPREIHLDSEMPSQVRRMDIGDPGAFKLIASGTAI